MTTNHLNITETSLTPNIPQTMGDIQHNVGQTTRMFLYSHICVNFTLLSTARD